jgi:hypothetical protein
VTSLVIAAIRSSSMYCAALDTLIAATIWPEASRTGADTQRMRSSFSSRS